MTKNSQLISELALEGAKQTVQALGVAKQMGMVNNESDLILLISSGIETTIDEYINRTEEQSKIILNETGNF